MCFVCASEHGDNSVSANSDSFTCISWFCFRYCNKELMPAVIFLINLCIAFICLNISYIISSFVGGSETTCKAFSFIFHYFLLVSCAALASMAFFTGVIPPFDGKKKSIYLGPIAANWSMFPYRVHAAELIVFPISFQYFPSS